MQAPPVWRASPPKPQRDAVTSLTPSEIVVAADQARADATGYVAWKQSRADNIDRLTTLTFDLNTSVAKMRANALRGKYRPVDVIAARDALRAVRSFLANKGD